MWRKCRILFGSDLWETPGKKVGTGGNKLWLKTYLKSGEHEEIVKPQKIKTHVTVEGLSEVNFRILVREVDTC